MEYWEKAVELQEPEVVVLPVAGELISNLYKKVVAVELQEPDVIVLPLTRELISNLYKKLVVFSECLERWVTSEVGRLVRYDIHLLEYQSCLFPELIIVEKLDEDSLRSIKYWITDFWMFEDLLEEI